MAEEFKAACVIGWPVAHSRSPMIHNHWIGKLGLNAEYRREGVPPGFDSFAQALGLMRRQNDAFRRLARAPFGKLLHAAARAGAAGLARRALQPEGAGPTRTWRGS